jgi:hypothetical protein
VQHAAGTGLRRSPAAPTVRVRNSARREDRYQPYRRAPSKARESERRRARSEAARPRAGPGFTLHMFPDRETPARRRLFLLVVLLAVTGWGAVSARRGELRLREVEAAAVQATAQLREGLPIVAWEGRALTLRLRRGISRIF